MTDDTRSDKPQRLYRREDARPWSELEAQVDFKMAWLLRDAVREMREKSIDSTGADLTLVRTAHGLFRLPEAPDAQP